MRPTRTSDLADTNACSSNMTRYGHESADAEGPLSSLLALIPQSSIHTLDFSPLDPTTYAILSEAASQCMADKEQDNELRRALSSKNRVLESKLDRLQRELAQLQDDLASAFRREEEAKALTSVAQNQLEASEASKSQLIQELHKCKRDCQGIKAAARQGKLLNERSTARNRERFSEATIAVARNAGPKMTVIKSVFASTETEACDFRRSHLDRQLEEAEAQRTATLVANSTLRRLYTEALNALRSMTYGISAQATSSASQASVWLQSDLFPAAEKLPRDYDLRNKPGTHPAIDALASTSKESEKALYQWDKDYTELKAARVALKQYESSIKIAAKQDTIDDTKTRGRAETTTPPMLDESTTLELGPGPSTSHSDTQSNESAWSASSKGDSASCSPRSAQKRTRSAMDQLSEENRDVYSSGRSDATANTSGESHPHSQPLQATALRCSKASLTTKNTVSAPLEKRPRLASGSAAPQPLRSVSGKLRAPLTANPALDSNRPGRPLVGASKEPTRLSSSQKTSVRGTSSTSASVPAKKPPSLARPQVPSVKAVQSTAGNRPANKPVQGAATADSRSKRNLS